MAGTINFALTQQFDMDGNPLSGGLLYFFAASTTTPQSAFQDIALTIPHPNPIVLDASGRVPMFYLADGNIKIRLATKGGVTVIAADNLLVIGPSSGGGGGGSVDPTTVMATGDIKSRFGLGPLGGFVRCNGETVGNAVSGSTERANADCQALFEYLWSTTVLGVFAGATPSRGATANADWLANKRIALPDLRGRTIAGMDDMGASAASRLTSTYFGTSGIVLGNVGGTENVTLSTAQLPSHTHANTVNNGIMTGSTQPEIDNQFHAMAGSTARGLLTVGGGNAPFAVSAALTGQTINVATGAGGNVYLTSAYSSFDLLGALGGSWTGNTGAQIANHTHSLGALAASNVTISNQPIGGGGAHASVQPSMILTFYIKL